MRGEPVDCPVDAGLTAGYGILWTAAFELHTHHAVFIQLIQHAAGAGYKDLIV
jgi:hypothetical protein